MAKPDLFTLASDAETIARMQFEIDSRDLVIACLVSALKKAKSERLIGHDLDQVRGALAMGYATLGVQR